MTILMLIKLPHHSAQQVHQLTRSAPSAARGVEINVAAAAELHAPAAAAATPHAAAAAAIPHNAAGPSSAAYAPAVAPAAVPATVLPINPVVTPASAAATAGVGSMAHLPGLPDVRALEDTVEPLIDMLQALQVRMSEANCVRDQFAAGLQPHLRK